MIFHVKSDGGYFEAAPAANKSKNQEFTTIFKNYLNFSIFIVNFSKNGKLKFMINFLSLIKRKLYEFLTGSQFGNLYLISSFLLIL
ncbi:hypothetical protein BpHYR1_000964 [Brachionus plicatilis]|uniref:Uncharacterized protein n=1 Tax=Brachionus plicatilis TaxID=10195 RepID=A0A3M7QDW0_BRAPC|nr:hypothetical protein BpHYR1_000964 [Brachionus plicatilis]